ncbi:MAG: DUF4105 domain-containing protein [Candidatus Reddybacter sp.]
MRPTWQALLHVPPHSLGSQASSLVDAPSFFLSSQGKESPQAELEATLAKLFAPSVGSKLDAEEAVACRFPARRAWLEEVLEIDKGVLPEYRCSNLNNWLHNFDADGLTLIFPVSVLNSPASMFGHTFLRLDRKAEKKPDLVAWTVNFAAYADAGRGLGFAINGVFGGYPGRFTLAPYYERVKAYSDIENRDIWECALNYSPAEVHFMLLHLWELLPAYFDYFFIDENCSYQLLGLLEAARPNLQLTKNFYWDATPADTVRAIASVPDLVAEVHYRPSLRQNINTRAEALALAEQKIAKSLALGQLTLQDESFLSKAPDSQVEIIELATSYLAYLSASQGKPQDVFDIALEAESRGKQHDEQLSRQHQLLTARSEIAIALPPLAITPPAYRPDEGHGSRRLALRYGREDAENYLQLDFRWVYHDLYDPDNGFVEGAQLAFLQPSFRYYSKDNNWQFEGVDFIDISSAPVRNYFIRPFSWKASAALKRYRFEDDERPLIGDLAVAAGLSYALNQQVSAAVFIDTKLTVSDKFDNTVGLGLGASGEIMYTISDTWKGGVYSSAMQYVEGLTQTTYQVGGRLRFSLDTDNAVLVEVSEHKEFSDAFVKGQLSWQLYF